MTTITKNGLNKLFELSDHKPEIIDFSKLSQAVEEKKEEAKAPAKKVKKDEGKIEDAKQIGIEYTKEQNFSKWYQ